jgi:hypothetical protein
MAGQHVKSLYRELSEYVKIIQELDIIMETVSVLYMFLYQYGVGPPFPFSTATIISWNGLTSFEH